MNNQRQLTEYNQPSRLAEALVEAGLGHNEEAVVDIHGVEVRSTPGGNEVMFCNSSVEKKKTLVPGDGGPISDLDSITGTLENVAIPKKPGWFRIERAHVRLNGIVTVKNGVFVEMTE